MSKTYRDLTPDEAVALVDSGANIEVGWLRYSTTPLYVGQTEFDWHGYDLEFDWCPELAKSLRYRVEVE